MLKYPDNFLIDHIFVERTGIIRASATNNNGDSIIMEYNTEGYANCFGDIHKTFSRNVMFFDGFTREVILSAPNNLYKLFMELCKLLVDGNLRILSN